MTQPYPRPKLHNPEDLTRWADRHNEKVEKRLMAKTHEELDAGKSYAK